MDTTIIPNTQQLYPFGVCKKQANKKEHVIEENRKKEFSMLKQHSLTWLLSSLIAEEGSSTISTKRDLPISSSQDAKRLKLTMSDLPG